MSARHTAKPPCQPLPGTFWKFIPKTPAMSIGDGEDRRPARDLAQRLVLTMRDEREARLQHRGHPVALRADVLVEQLELFGDITEVGAHRLQPRVRPVLDRVERAEHGVHRAVEMRQLLAQVEDPARGVALAVGEDIGLEVDDVVIQGAGLDDWADVADDLREDRPQDGADAMDEEVGPCLQRGAGAALRVGAALSARHDEVAAEEDGELAEVRPRVLAVVRGAQDDEVHVARVRLELRPVVAQEDVLHRDLVQAEALLQLEQLLPRGVDEREPVEPELDGVHEHSAGQRPSSSCRSATTVTAPARRSCSGLARPRATPIARSTPGGAAASSRRIDADDDGPVRPDRELVEHAATRSAAPGR